MPALLLAQLIVTAIIVSEAPVAGVMTGVGNVAVAVKETCAVSVSLVNVTVPVAGSVPSKVTVTCAEVLVAGMEAVESVKCASLHVTAMGLERNAEVTSITPVKVVLLKLKAPGVTANAGSWAMV